MMESTWKAMQIDVHQAFFPSIYSLENVISGNFGPLIYVTCIKAALASPLVAYDARSKSEGFRVG